MNTNFILDTDSYKFSHYQQFPPHTVGMFNYLESRGGRYDQTVFFGLQYLLKEYLSKPITLEDVKQAEDFAKKHGVPFNTEGWTGIVKDYNGFLSVHIKAVDEGSVIPTKLPLLSVQSTDPKYFWVVGWIETFIMRLWYPITVCTQSYHIKKIIQKYLELTADDLSGLPFKLHDFGSRGVSSRESAAIGGASHLVNFMGSDTIVGVLMANEYYGHEMSGFSIPASEHSTITSWGKDHELDAYRNMLDKYAKPGSILAVVSDSYNIYHAVQTLWGEKLKQQIIDSGATVVIRPDSGDPVSVVNQVVHTLARKFGTVRNTKGFEVLNNVRVIQGDGVNEPTIEAILKSLKLAGFSADNIAFGMGGALLQGVNRDTQRFAFKCSEVTIEKPGSVPESRLVFKDPIDDPGKRSKAGRLGTKLVDAKYEVCMDSDPNNLLKTRYYNGVINGFTTLNDIRARAK